MENRNNSIFTFCSWIYHSGALLKAAFICCEVIDYPSTVSLHDQLLYKYGGGFEIRSWSNMPHGSGQCFAALISHPLMNVHLYLVCVCNFPGLGTSSILAGAVMAALWRASGRRFDISSLIHAVSYTPARLPWQQR